MTKLVSLNYFPLKLQKAQNGKGLYEWLSLQQHDLLSDKLINVTTN
jgi:hypothetical protein